MDTTLPNLFLVGAAASGSTSMWSYLRQHPEIFMASFKEPRYLASDLWGEDKLLTEDEYLSLFEGASGEPWRGEASPWNLYSPQACKRLADWPVDPKILIMLRDPVDRMRSLFYVNLCGGVEDVRSLEEAITLEDDRRRGRKLPPFCSLPIAHRYLENARYAEHVERYLEHHGRENVHVILFRDFAENPRESYMGVLRFLGVDESFDPSLEVNRGHKNVRSYLLTRARIHLLENPKLRRWLPHRLRKLVVSTLDRVNRYEEPPPEVPNDLEERLRKDLDDDIQHLETLLQQDLSSWRHGVG